MAKTTIMTGSTITRNARAALRGIALSAALAAGVAAPATLMAVAPASAQSSAAAQRIADHFSSISSMHGDFVQFGVGPHTCPGDKMSKLLMRDHLIKTWADGYDFELVSGLQEGEKGIEGIGIEGAWVECNFGTPNARGGDVHIKVSRRGEKVN